jgi:hypothetical protein
VPSPLQKVPEVAPVPEFKLVTGRLPVTSVVKSTAPHEGFPEALPCKTVVVVPWFLNKALANTGLKYVGTAELLVLLPSIV